MAGHMAHDTWLGTWHMAVVLTHGRRADACRKTTLSLHGCCNSRKWHTITCRRGEDKAWGKGAPQNRCLFLATMHAGVHESAAHSMLPSLARTWEYARGGGGEERGASTLGHSRGAMRCFFAVCQSQRVFVPSNPETDHRLLPIAARSLVWLPSERLASTWMGRGSLPRQGAACPSGAPLAR
eukprot:243826-Chlamydomonas_euryale.AAC.3